MEMRKYVSVIMALLMVFGGCLTVFAATETALTDVAGTKYEAAVKDLVSKNIIKGYEDQTFKPENTITRAEACVVVVNALGATDAQLTAAKDSGFTDLAGYDWAKKYINYASEKGIVSGYGNGLVKPAGNVTYNEMAVMLVNASGVKATELTGTWPLNYVNKATELGMFRAVIPADASFDTGAAATRGNVALMTFAVAEKIAQANKEEVPGGTTTNGAVNTTGSATTTTGSATTTTSGVSSTGKLADYTGNATGMINGVTKVVNKDGESVQQLEFLMGNETMHLNTDGKADVKSIVYDGSVYTLKMQNGVVKEIAADGGRLKNFVELTTKNNWQKVTGRDDKIVTLDGTPAQLTIMKDAIFYEVKFSGNSIDSYRSTTLSSISKDCAIRAYDVTDDKTANADIVVIVKASDVSKL